MSTKKTAPAPAEHPSGLDAGARARVREIIDEWEDRSLRMLPFHEHLRELVAEPTEPEAETEAEA